MSVSNGQDANESVFNAAFVSKTSDSILDANIFLTDGKFICLKGNLTTDGSIRIGVDNDAVVIEKRVSGNWITLWSVEE